MTVSQHDAGPPRSSLAEPDPSATAFPAPLSDAIATALAAAAAATDAAHEAEAALLSRSTAAEAMRRTSRTMTTVAAAACGASVLVLLFAGFMSLRSAGALRAATEAQNAAGLAFVSQLAELRHHLDGLSTAAKTISAAEASAILQTAAPDTGTGAESPLTTPAETPPRIDGPAGEDILRRLDTLEVTMIEALADLQLSLVQGRNAAPPTASAVPEQSAGAEDAALTAIDAAAARLSDVIDRLEERASTAPSTPAPAASAPAAQSARQSEPPPAPSRPAPNPFRFP